VCVCVCVCVYVCVCVSARARAWLGVFGISTGEKNVVISLLLNTIIKHTTIVVFHD